MRTIFHRLTRSLIISILSVIVLGCSAYAANIDATVPASLPITVSSDGVVTTATNAAIHNYGSSPIFVSSINVTAENGWSLATKDAAASASIGAKVISMGFNGSWMDASGAVDTSGFDRISSSGTLNLSYDAKTPGVVTAESSSTAATATFVVGLPTPPTMAANSSWYKSTRDGSTITKITFMDSYTPASCDEKWAADVNGTGDITCYKTGTEVIIAGNGAGKIMANTDSSNMFVHFSHLASIENLSLFDTAQVTNMSYMFYCSDLTSLDVSGFDTSNVTNMSYMFKGCSGLTSIDVSGFDTSKVTNMSYMFGGCSGLTSIDVSGFDTSKVTDMSYMFGGCSGLTSIDVSGFDTSKVTDMSFMFYNCNHLTSLDVSGFDTANVTNMSSMFNYCRGLTSLDLSHLDTSKVTNMSNMFSNCRGLTSLDLSSLDTSQVTNMSNMFSNCSGLTSLNLSHLDTSKDTNMGFMFSGCRVLTTIYVGDAWNTDKVTSSDSMFTDCSKLKGAISYDSSKTDATYANWTTGYLTYKALPATLAEGSRWYKSAQDRNTITKITFMDSYTPASYDEKWAADVDGTGDITCYRTGTEIIIAGNGSGKIKANADSSYLFSARGYDCFTELTSIENLALVDTSNVTNMNWMFYNCSGLTSLNLSNFNTANVTDMFHMFGRCEGLTSLDISGFDTANVTDMSYMFDSCSKLASLDVSRFNTSQVTNMSGMFSYCRSLASLDVSRFNTSQVTNMSNMFESCSKLASLDVSRFNTSKTTNMASMFCWCSSLSSLDVSGFDTSNVTNMYEMFNSCRKLPSLDVSGFDTSNVTNMNWMFDNCSGLTTIYAGDAWNTDKVTSSSRMFTGCTVLQGDIAYNSKYVDKTYAKTSGGYLTYKAASTKTLSLNIDPNSGAVTSYDVSTNPISRFRAFLDWSDTANVA